MNLIEQTLLFKKAMEALMAKNSYSSISEAMAAVNEIDLGNGTKAVFETREGKRKLFFRQLDPQKHDDL